MTQFFCKRLLTIAVTVVLILQSTMLPAIAEELLPQPDPQFNGKKGFGFQNQEVKKNDL